MWRIDMWDFLKGFFGMLATIAMSLAIGLACVFVVVAFLGPNFASLGILLWIIVLVCIAAGISEYDRRYYD
jgi:hypothetical protein